MKQWANDKENYLNLRDAQGKLFTLKPYMELEDDDLDPIEFYAYYLGLYINNMYQKICLRYLLSYPVTYSMEVREHIRSSFERGLKKSLPPLILHDQDCMKRFSVKLGANEAVAYALSALKTYNLEPKEKGESISYAVFDFGVQQIMILVLKLLKADVSGLKLPNTAAAATHILEGKIYFI